jgi:hypothetical protein
MAMAVNMREKAFPFWCGASEVNGKYAPARFQRTLLSQCHRDWRPCLAPSGARSPARRSRAQRRSRRQWLIAPRIELPDQDRYADDDQRDIKDKDQPGNAAGKSPERLDRLSMNTDDHVKRGLDGQQP